MFQLEKIFCSVILCLVLPYAEGRILGNDIFADFEKYNLGEIKIVPTKNTNTSKEETIDSTKGMSIVINPVIHNIAQSYGSGVDKNTDVSTTPPVIITYPPHFILMVNNICMIFKKGLNLIIQNAKAIYSLANFLLNPIFIKMEGLIWGLIRYIICSFVPICGFLGVFGDEVDSASLDLAEDSISRGLAFVQGIMEQYHAAQNGTLVN